MTDARMGSGQMFDNIADGYDRLNRIMSMGVDQSWRRKTVAALNVTPGARVLDLATGTGDLAIQIAETHPDCTVVGVDPSVNMLRVGRTKVDAAKLSKRVTLLEGDAQSLPFDPGSLDAACIAFGIRNVPDRERGLREMARVVKPGGRVCVLELSEPKQGVLSPFARFHIRQVVPRLGAWLSGSKEYRYLQESIAAFPDPEDFAAMMERAGLQMVSLERLTLGVCCLYVAESKGGSTSA
ncbi:MAG: bifunctional demethylmenaquinone methyltransferase/2-methoxy-6-polyprenyl-1,4-benzoquinol methylase UbiE [Sandaracinaceae bacterium]|nr:bifunctional demethylmenaquinone methyltransferase/2-methoxy-6-polyprenyl-1,4-benzoquinol methylase UbiE [Sandaracinaceae bacterium]MBP7682947.1 bifunctional demethylmenaquinone methyltransferase/2-methoxy-6-polyprenyl-1,4-benzoquinol methylase UbiE [Deltaproteobacteria bacterium]MBK6809845.1 bifunctional demethylmenaquinone methyltransferase/2-methoxy-6-polyprenyl-1,4-benzoquinol methylase UbiE [Sandaracinaceae bacterium]MBK7155663.1 bifunctional demethylmenaquinone methyltransferase/2-metho